MKSLGAVTSRFVRFFEGIDETRMIGFAGLAWAAALLFTAGAGHQYLEVRKTNEQVSALKAASPLKINVVESAVSPDDLKRVAEQVRLMHPSMSVAAEPEGIRITALGEERFFDFRYAIGTAMNALPDARWRTQTLTLCGGAGCQGANYLGILKASRIRVDVTG